MAAEPSVIMTPRLFITPFSEENLTPRYVNWLNDPEVVKYSEQRHCIHTIGSCRKYWESFIDSDDFFWAITLREGHLGHIGNINAYVDKNNLIAEVGIVIGERIAWGKGLGLEAWTAVCDFMLKVVGIRKVTAGTMVTNRRMLNLMHRSGMIEDGKRTRHYVFEGYEVDIQYFALFRYDKT